MKPDGSASQEARERGRHLYERGGSLPACASCHGAKGEGVAAQPQVPVIAGQEWRYLDKQLRDWRAGERRNSPDTLMSQVTKGLSDKDIEDLASHLSGM
jgi:cytochrome c553